MRVKRLLLISPIIILESTGRLVSKIIIEPNFSNNTEVSNWQCDTLKFNKHKNEVLKYASDKSFFFDNV